MYIVIPIAWVRGSGWGAPSILPPVLIGMPVTAGLDEKSTLLRLAINLMVITNLVNFAQAPIRHYALEFRFSTCHEFPSEALSPVR